MSSMPKSKLDKFLACVQKITLLIKEAREGASDRQDRDFGDDAQVLGIRAYKNLVDTIERIKGTAGYEWLQSYDAERRLTLHIKIGDDAKDRILLRIWRSNDPDNKPEIKRLILPALAQMNLELFPSDAGVIDRWGLVYQTTPERLLDTAYLIGFDSRTQEVIESHEITLSQELFSGVIDLDSLPEARKISVPNPKLKSVREASDGE